MRAAERLIAKHGIENISIRSIVAEAGQKNESALQYHFSNLTGLIEAIQAERFELIKRQRESMTEALLRYSPTPTLQQLCDLMVMPVVHLARQDEEFLFFIRAFSSLPLMTEASPWSLINSLANGAPTDHAMVTMLRERLPHLDRQAFHHRMDAAVRRRSMSGTVIGVGRLETRMDK